MLRHKLLILFLLLLSNNAISDILPTGFINNFDYSSVKPTIVPYSELTRSENDENGALWVGFFLETDIDPFYAGEIINWENGETSWIIKINSPGAPALAVFFNQLSLSKDSRITVFPEGNPENHHTIFENEINTEIISFPIMAGETLIVEYTEKTVDNDEIKGFFVICDVMVIFRGFDLIYNSRGLGTADKCNVNINCSPEGDNWQNQKRSVVRMVLVRGSSSYLCSGSLINNTNNDGTPYVITANHCAGDASVSEKERWQFYFNYERLGCENSGNPPTNLLTGCSLVSRGELNGGSDFQLLLLKTSVNPKWKPFFNGWDINNNAATSGVCIHHPDGDAKKISTYNNPAKSITPMIDGQTMAQNSAWQINWSDTENGHGITEKGSSGSPLFNSRGLLVGTLTGGNTNCNESLNSFDVFGKFSYHWQSNGSTNNSQLCPWLDPNNSGVRTHSSYDPEFIYHNVTFNVINTWNDPVENAKIDIEVASEPKVTNREGKVTILLPEIYYTYKITHINYFDVTGKFEVREGGELTVYTENEKIIEDGKIKLKENLQYISLFLNQKTGRMDIANAEKVENIKIYDFIGHLIYECKINGETEKSIDVSFLPQGLYVFVTHDTRGANKKFKLLKSY